MLLFVVAAHLLLLLFVLHNSFISDGSRVSCLDQFPLSLKTSGNLQDDRLQLLRIQILPDAEQADWSLSTGPISSYLISTLSYNTAMAVEQRNPSLSFIYAPQKSLLALLEYPDALQPDVTMDTLYLPRDSQCFKLRWFNGLPLWRWIRDCVIGYDTIVENQLLKHFGVKGVLMKVYNRAVVEMNYGVFNPDLAAQSALVEVSRTQNQDLARDPVSIPRPYSVGRFRAHGDTEADVTIRNPLPQSTVASNSCHQSYIDFPLTVARVCTCSARYSVLFVRALQGSSACNWGYDDHVGGRIVLGRHRTYSTLTEIFPPAVLLSLHVLPHLHLLLFIWLLVRGVGDYKRLVTPVDALLLELL